MRIEDEFDEWLEKTIIEEMDVDDQNLAWTLQDIVEEIHTSRIFTFFKDDPIIAHIRFFKASSNRQQKLTKKAVEKLCERGLLRKVGEDYFTNY